MEILYSRVVDIPSELPSISGMQDPAQLLGRPDVGNRYLLPQYVPWASVARQLVGVPLKIKRADAIGRSSGKFSLIFGRAKHRAVNAEVGVGNQGGQDLYSGFWLATSERTSSRTVMRTRSK
jgi:hypothetical protein